MFKLDPLTINPDLVPGFARGVCLISIYWLLSRWWHFYRLRCNPDLHKVWVSLNVLLPFYILFATVHLFMGESGHPHRHWHDALLAISHILLLATVGVMVPPLSRMVRHPPEQRDPAVAHNRKPGSGAR